MLPSEKLELAIYQHVNALEPPVDVSVTQLSQETRENDYGKIVERLKDLQSRRRIVLSKYSGGQIWPRGDFPDKTFFYTGSFLVQIAPEGRKYFEELEQRAEQETKATIVSESLVFVSCGQSTPAERQLGMQVARLVKQETGCEAYFAENQNSLQGVTENILKQLNKAVGFIAIMHPRGNVSHPQKPEKTWVRGSVWVEQEIAIAAFISQALERPMQVRAYVHESILREGLRDKLHLNPTLFRDDPEILTDLASILPSWREWKEQRSKESFSLKPNVRFTQVPVPGGGEDRRYAVTVTVENDGEQDARDYTVDVEFPTMFVDGGVYLSMKGTNNAGMSVFEGSNKNQRLGSLYPGTESSPIVTFYCAIRSKTIRENPEHLQQKVKAVVSSGNMKPKILSKTIAELLG
jgi:hypothetical protein